MKKIAAIDARSFKSQVVKLAKKHGKVLVVSMGDGGFRRRLIKEDGDCTVSYKYHGNHRWSRFTESCFMEYTENQEFGGYHDWNDRYIRRTVKKGKKKTVKNTVEALLKHDKDCEIIAVEIKYGRGLRKSIFVKQKY